MAAFKKRLIARVSNAAGQSLATWIDFDFHGFTKELNGGLGEFVIDLPYTFDYDGIDIQTGNDVQLLLFDRDTAANSTDGSGVRLLYRGYISLVERTADGGKEAVRVHLLGYYTLLSLDILKNGSQTTLYSMATDGLTTTSGSQSAADIGAIVRAVLDRYRAENTDAKIFYLGTSDVPDTGTTATYTFQQKTYRDAINRLKDIAPPNVYWYADEYGRFSFKETPSTPTHQFLFDKHFSSVHVETSFEQVRNVVLVWDGDPSGTYKQYKDDLSIASYGRRVAAVNDYGIKDEDAADAFGAKFLAENKDAAVKVRCTILDNNGDENKGYDIESIQPGDTCSFNGFSSTLTDIFRGNMLITKVDYTLDSATPEVELVKSGLIDVQARQARDIQEIGSGGLGVPASYS